MAPKKTTNKQINVLIFMVLYFQMYIWRWCNQILIHDFFKDFFSLESTMAQIVLNQTKSKSLNRVLLKKVEINPASSVKIKHLWFISIFLNSFAFFIILTFILHTSLFNLHSLFYIQSFILHPSKCYPSLYIFHLHLS